MAGLALGSGVRLHNVSHFSTTLSFCFVYVKLFVTKRHLKVFCPLVFEDVWKEHHWIMARRQQPSAIATETSYIIRCLSVGVEKIPQLTVSGRITVMKQKLAPMTASLYVMHQMLYNTCVRAGWGFDYAPLQSPPHSETLAHLQRPGQSKERTENRW